MHTHFRPPIKITALLLLLGLAFGVVGAQDDASGEPIRIGIPNPYTPPGNVIYGEESRIGVDIAIDMWEDLHGTPDGRPIELIHADTQGDPAAGRDAVERLILQDRVDILVGCNHSSVGLVISRLANEHNVPFVVMNCWSDEIRHLQYPQVFAPSNFSSRTGEAIASVVQGLDVDSFVMFAENTDFGLGQAELIEQMLNENAPEIDVETHIVDRQARDFTSEILPLKGNPPDLIGLVLVPPGGFLFTEQLADQEVAPSSETLVIDVGGYVDQPGFWDAVGDAGLYHLAYVLHHPSISLTDLGQEVADRYTTETGNEPTRLVFQGFDALWVALDALDRSAEINSEAIINALQDTNLEATRGTIHFENEPLWQQWPEIPFAVVQFQDVGQAPAKAPVVFPEESASTGVIYP